MMRGSARLQLLTAATSLSTVVNVQSWRLLSLQHKQISTASESSKILGEVTSHERQVVHHNPNPVVTNVPVKGGLSQRAYLRRHLGHYYDEDTTKMLKTLGLNSIEDLMQIVIPKGIACKPLRETPPLSESHALRQLSNIMSRNKVFKSMIGHGYYEAITPSVIQRCVFENPAWYTPYTPYQAEISQGRLEGLLNFQTMIMELTGTELANASLLDQATAASEAMMVSFRHYNEKRKKYFVSTTCFPSVIEMVRTRASVLGIEVVVGNISTDCNLADPELFGVMVQTPDALGALHDFTELCDSAKDMNIVTCCNTDLLACCILKPPGEMGADIVVGSAQRFGIPLGFGGPHAAFFACRDSMKRMIPGRIVGVSKDVHGNQAVRLALQTREQHIKREKATSNVCTAQALLANMSAMYAVYHGAEGLRDIAQELHNKARLLCVGLEAAQHAVVHKIFFDTVTIKPGNGQSAQDFATRCSEKGINVFVDPLASTVSISVDEATTDHHLAALLEAAGLEDPRVTELGQLIMDSDKMLSTLPDSIRRETDYLTSPVFKLYRTEHEIMRYISRLQRKDYGLTHGLIPLGSCTMKLNAASAMMPLSWPTVGNIHPMAPSFQCRGYEAMCIDLSERLQDISGLDAVSLQPNSGAQGEYCGLRCIRSYQQSVGEGHRKYALIPQSAHGTNFASTSLAGLKVITLKCNADDGRVCFRDLDEKLEQYGKDLSVAMITYPSTYGVYDANIKEICAKVHNVGAQVYIDGANLNAMVGFSGPGYVGGDVCHFNMHKTFSIPHGGGGPGMGPIAVAQHLAPFLPNTVFGANVGGSQAFGQVSQAANGSASILTVSYMLMLMLGSEGLKECTSYAVLNSNYLRKRLESHYPILYTGANGYCAHEFIIDIRQFKKTAGIDAEDIAKRLMDYGIHAPTQGFPVIGTLMIEPTESESLAELDRLADALISIRQEIREIEEGKLPKENNMLVNAPHTMAIIATEKWDKPYSRERAAFPSKFARIEKFWPTVSRVDGATGDRLFAGSCACFLSNHME